MFPWLILTYLKVNCITLAANVIIIVTIILQFLSLSHFSVPQEVPNTKKPPVSTFYLVVGEWFPFYSFVVKLKKNSNEYIA